MEDLLIMLASYAVPGLGLLGVVFGFARKAAFYVKVAQQAISTFEEVKEDSKEIYHRVVSDPERKELAKVISGGVKKIEGLKF